MPKVIMVQHINVQITNRQRTQEWYENVLGATFRDRGPARNQRQLQLHLGNAEMHFTELDNPTIPTRVHFAVEVDNWDDMLAHLETQGVAYSRGQSALTSSDTDEPRWGSVRQRRALYLYQRPRRQSYRAGPPPLGLADADGNTIELPSLPRRLRWRQLPEVEAALGTGPVGKIPT